MKTVTPGLRRADPGSGYDPGQSWLQTRTGRVDLARGALGIYEPDTPEWDVFQPGDTTYLHIGDHLPNWSGRAKLYLILPPDADTTRPVTVRTRLASNAGAYWLTSGRPTPILMHHTHGSYEYGECHEQPDGTWLATDTGIPSGSKGDSPNRRDIDLEVDSPGTEDVSGWTRVYHIEVDYHARASGMWPLRQRQSLIGPGSWPLRQRQTGGHSGSWSLRQRQTGA